jgi:fructose-bisphosphate aldolase class II
MLDGSVLPFEENVKLTKHIVDICETVDVGVEGEIGHIGSVNDECMDEFTSPEEAAEFVKQTGVCCLAVLIGNAHGHYKKTPCLDIERVKAIREATGGIPLVLHGGTGILPEDFKKCIKLGINKINIATATFDSVEYSVRTAYENGAIKGYYDLQTAEVEGAYKNALKHIEIFGCASRV